MCFMCCLNVLFSFSLQVTDFDADDAKDDVPLSPSSPTADFPAETEIVNPVSKKNVTLKKTAAKSKPESLKWVNTGIK